MYVFWSGPRVGSDERTITMKIKYYRLAGFIYRVFAGDVITIPQVLAEGFGWLDSVLLRSERELLACGAQETTAPY